MREPAPDVVDFYDRHPINETQVLASARDVAAAPRALRPEDLWQWDQDHYGGLHAVEALARRAAIAPGMAVLDVCAGLGGPARFLAHRFGVRAAHVVCIQCSRIAGLAAQLALTNLLNRRGLPEAANRELMPYTRGLQDFAVAVGDLDPFKALNDTYDHAFGDEVLELTARLLCADLRQTDIVARTGGEEFVLLLPLTDDDDMVAVLERVRMLLEQQRLKTKSGAAAVVTISIGVANTRGRTGLNWTDLQNEADSALYEAKRAGRNRIVRAPAGTVHPWRLVQDHSSIQR